MAAILIKDLPSNSTLDRDEMEAIRGGDGAPWVFGAFVPYVERQPANGSFGQVVNLYEITNNYYADQMNNQFQSVNVNNTGANSNINLAANEVGANIKHQ